MGLIVKRLNPKNINYNSLKGSGLIKTDDICKLEQCKPTSNPINTSIVPKQKVQSKLIPLIATKISLSSNKWERGGQTFKTFNSLWINIPSRKYTVLRIGQQINGESCR